MCNLLNFDIQSRGCKSLVQDWVQEHNELKGHVWPLEDIVEKVNAGMKAAFFLFDEFRMGKMPAPGFPFSYLVECYKHLLWAAERLVAEAEQVQSEYQHEITGLPELRTHIAALGRIIEEDGLATDAAFLIGGLGDQP